MPPLGTLEITAASINPALLDLPWDTPLAEWPDNTLAALPRGISRHIVRFVRLSGQVLAVKEIGETVARSEYEMLRHLERLEMPSVKPVAVITGRKDANGEYIEAALVTKHLQFSLPYRVLFQQQLGADVATRLIDALAVLMVRLHLIGFYWGDVSLSNTLFLRDADQFSAYLVDAETARIYPSLTDGQRNWDLELAQTNITGELMDLHAGGFLDEDDDPFAIGQMLIDRYHELWGALTATESFDVSERWRIDARLDLLNRLGFDVDELSIRTDGTDSRVYIRPKVVEAGHHARRLLRLTGLQVQENQARRLLNDLDTYRATEWHGLVDDEVTAAHHWLEEVFEPAIRAIPRELHGKLQAAQLYHELLDHRWYRSQDLGRDVSLGEAVKTYVSDVLTDRPDEEAILGLPPDSKDIETGL